MLAWFGGTDKGSKVGRALIARQGGTGRPGQKGCGAEPVSSSPPSHQLLPIEVELLGLGIRRGPNLPFLPGHTQTHPDIQLHLWIGFRKVKDNKAEMPQEETYQRVTRYFHQTQVLRSHRNAG